ncbi:MAG: TlyA family RNA methyltransferase [Ruminococcaceae bacterium]|nr:TlyA family RNA methyltransferase [Oscillospiraceae bacterium]
MRLDAALVERDIFKSRTRAQRAIEEGCVTVNGKVITKPSFSVAENDEIMSSGDPLPYVSRGGLKLQGAFDSFGISVKGLCCVDIGASTGGFTEVLLINGAESVCSVDVGHSQLDETILNNPKVRNMEKTDFRNMPEEYNGVFDFACSDVSFISVTLLLPRMYCVLKQGGSAVVLIKPQFESDTKKVGKNGIVRDVNARKRALSKVTSCAEACGFNVKGIVESPVKGGDGNVEYLMWVKK